MIPLPKHITEPAFMDVDGAKFLLARKDGELYAWKLSKAWELQGKITDTAFYESLPKLRLVA